MGFSQKQRTGSHLFSQVSAGILLPHLDSNQKPFD